MSRTLYTHWEVKTRGLIVRAAQDPIMGPVVLLDREHTSSLTPSTARQLAIALNGAADAAEEETTNMAEIDRATDERVK